MFARFLMTIFVFISAGGVSAQEVPEWAINAVKAADSEDYGLAEEFAQDQVTKDIVRWIRLRAGNAEYAEYVAFLETRSDWPGQSRILQKAEEAMPAGLDADEVIAWFGDRAPETGEGAVRLAEAMTKRGEIEAAKDVVRAAWRDLRLTAGGQRALQAAFADVLADVHDARIDNLLWRWRTTEAERMLDQLDDDARALAEARIAYIRKQGDIDKKAKAVPAALKGNPGLAYDRYNWLADKGNRTEAVAILRARSTSAEALGEPFRWSGWRRSLARWEMRNGRPEVAYELASQHYLDADGSTYADLEWLAGFLKLTDLDDPAQALVHFKAARTAIKSPISVARMAYWQGRTHEVLGNSDAAQAAFAEGAEHQTAFYGLLAAEKLGRSLDPAVAKPLAAWDEALMDNDLVRAGFTLLAAGERGSATQFFVQIGRDLNAEQLAQIGHALDDAGEVYFAVAMGKAAVTQGKVVPGIYFPMHPLAETNLPVPAALALSIARRESEFNAGVGSPVGALGLMQLMPATAEEVAGFEGVNYSRTRLTDDWAYNARLGSRYLLELQNEFGPSPVQIAAGYNAGPSRPEIWMDERGDPRIGEVDVVDWIEHIPFRETRNYVMRVSESIPVYRARLTGHAGPLNFTQLLLGEKPLLRPVARDDAARDAAEPDRAVARPSTSSAPAPRGPRPVARPGG